MTVVPSRDWKYHERHAMNRDEQNKASLTSAISRARSTVRRRCLAIDAKRMLTFTMPGADKWNDQELSDAWRMFRNVLQRLRRKGIAFQYVAVPEKQGRGAWHFHVAVDRYLRIQAIQREWFAVGGGNVDVKLFKHRHYSNAVEGCSGYIAKYIGKDLEGAEFGRNRYRTSRGIKIDIERVNIEKKFFGNPLLIRETFESVTGKKSGNLNLWPEVITVASWGDQFSDFRMVLRDG